jgi:hypothetical protein
MECKDEISGKKLSSKDDSKKEKHRDEIRL